MLPEQEQAIREVTEGVDILADSLMQLCDLDEEDALTIIRELPDLTSKIQDHKLAELFEAAARKVKHPRQVTISAENPDEYYPGHPKFMPNITTKSTFNEHFAQAIKPYMGAVLSKIAKDRGLQPPDTRVVNAVIDQTDWARAAYQAKKMPPKPPPSQLRRFFRKIFKPADRFGSKYVGAIFSAAISAQFIYLVWAAFRHSLEASGGAVKSFTPYSHASQQRVQDRFQRKLGIPRRYRQYKTY